MRAIAVRAAPAGQPAHLASDHPYLRSSSGQHASAAVAFGLPTVCPLERPCLTVASGTALRDLADAHLHRATMIDADVLTVAGFGTLAPARTALDIAREHGVDAGVAAADAALHRGADVGLRPA